MQVDVSTGGIYPLDMETIDTDQLIDAAGAAEIMGVPVTTVRQWLWLTGCGDMKVPTPEPVTHIGTAPRWTAEQWRQFAKDSGRSCEQCGHIQARRSR